MENSHSAITTDSTISSKVMAAYRKTARRRVQFQRQAMVERRERALQVAHRAAIMLKSIPGVCRVALFGSLARDDFFSHRSDIDLAIWGLDERLYFRMVSRLQALASDISVDLVMAEQASATLLQAIDSEGIAL